MTAVALPNRSAPAHAFRSLVRTETKLFFREPIALVWGLAFPIVLLVIMGLCSGDHGSKSLDGLRLVAVYTPIVIAFVIAMLALNMVPPVLAGYREKGILRRLALTPAGSRRVLGAHLAVDAAMTVVSIVSLVVVARLGFHVALPREVGGFILTLLLAIPALLAIGLFIASVAPTGRAANAAGAVTFFPCMFFAGLWIPRPEMPSILRSIGDYTPLGATVDSLQRSMAGSFPHPAVLIVLAAYAVVAGFAATRFFRWA